MYDEICTWAESIPEHPDGNLEAIIKVARVARTLSALNKLRVHLDRFEGENRVRLIMALDEKEAELKGKG